MSDSLLHLLVDLAALGLIPLIATSTGLLLVTVILLAALLSLQILLLLIKALSNLLDMRHILLGQGLLEVLFAKLQSQGPVHLLVLDELFPGHAGQLGVHDVPEAEVGEDLLKAVIIELMEGLGNGSHCTCLSFLIN